MGSQTQTMGSQNGQAALSGASQWELQDLARSQKRTEALEHELAESSAGIACVQCRRPASCGAMIPQLHLSPDCKGLVTRS